MGLDMYLNGRKFFWTQWETVDGAVTPSVKNRMEDGYQVRVLELELGYWRKHPNLHGFIVKSFANGVDECQEISLDVEGLKKIILACKVGGLPETSGFFFGRSPTMEDKEMFNEQIAEDVEILQRALTWLETPEPGVSREVFYRASW